MRPTIGRASRFHHVLSEELCLFAGAGFPANDKLPGDTLDFAEISQFPLIVPTVFHSLRESLEEAALSRNVQDRAGYRNQFLFPNQRVGEARLRSRCFAA